MTKDWSGNGKSTFITIGASNHTDKEREEHDFYSTSPEAIDKLLKSFSLPKKIWECACGTGCLSERLIEFGHDVVSTDLIDRGYGGVQDFFKAGAMPDSCKCILTNPPYKYALEFVLHSLDLLPDGGLCVMFLKTTFLGVRSATRGSIRTRRLSMYCNSQRECCAQRTASSLQCAMVVVVQSATLGLCGRMDIREKRP